MWAKKYECKNRRWWLAKCEGADISMTKGELRRLSENVVYGEGYAIVVAGTENLPKEDSVKQEIERSKHGGVFWAVDCTPRWRFIQCCWASSQLMNTKWRR